MVCAILVEGAVRRFVKNSTLGSFSLIYRQLGLLQVERSQFHIVRVCNNNRIFCLEQVDCNDLSLVGEVRLIHSCQPTAFQYCFLCCMCLFFCHIMSSSKQVKMKQMLSRWCKHLLGSHIFCLAWLSGFGHSTSLLHCRILVTGSPVLPMCAYVLCGR